MGEEGKGEKGIREKEGKGGVYWRCSVDVGPG